MASWWGSFGMVMRGFVPFALLAVGLLAMVSGVRRLSEPRSSCDEGEPHDGNLESD